MITIAAAVRMCTVRKLLIIAGAVRLYTVKKYNFYSYRQNVHC